MLIFLFALFCSCVFAYPPLALPKRQDVSKRQDILEPICGQIIDAVNNGEYAGLDVIYNIDSRRFLTLLGFRRLRLSPKCSIQPGSCHKIHPFFQRDSAIPKHVGLSQDASERISAASCGHSCQVE